MTLNHAFRVKRHEVPTVLEDGTESMVSKVLVHTRKLGWRQSSNDPKLWKPSAGVQFLLRTPEGQPKAQDLIPFELPELEHLRKIVQGFALNLGNKYTGDLQAYWNSQLSFQESLYEGNVTATAFDNIHLEADHELLALPPTQPVVARALTVIEQMAVLPETLQRQIILPERPVGTTQGRGLRRQAQLYADRGNFEVPFHNMKVNSYCIVLCPDGSEIPYGFKIKLTQKSYSQWLYLVRCDALERTTSSVTWKYVQPVSWTHTATRQLAITKAGSRDTWREDPDSDQTAPYMQDEVILAWDLTAEERFSGIPTEQYNQCKVVLTALNLQGDVAED